MSRLTYWWRNTICFYSLCYFEVFYCQMALKDLLSVNPQWLRSHVYIVPQSLHTSILGNKPKIKMLTTGHKWCNQWDKIDSHFILPIQWQSAERWMAFGWVICTFSLIMCLQRDERNKGKVMPETVALWNENLARSWHAAYCLRDQTARVQILAVPPSSRITLGKWFSISLPYI